MRLQITARHCDVSDTIRARAGELMERVARFDRRVSGVELVFEENRRSHDVEAIVSRDRVEPIVARASAPDWLPALDALFDRVSKQVRRGRGQAVDHHHSTSQEMSGN